MKQYGYYPGCSLERNAAAYQKSTMAVAPALGLTFNEIDDWNCCGATEYIALEKLPAYALVGRNLALAADQADNGHQLVAPCSACFLNLRKTDHYLRASPEMARQVNEALGAGGLHYEPGSITVRHLLEIVVDDVGFEAVKENVTSPLTGLRVAPYYGCLIVRPNLNGQFDDTEYPTSLDRLMSALGAKVVDYPVKAHCCGGHMTQISEPTALELIRRLLKSAADYEADMIVTICPMCQLNLDAYQDAVNARFGTNYNIPILYFTQLMGLAFGLSPSDVGIGQELVDARPALARVGAVEEETPKRRPSRRQKEEGLPMPTMPEEEVR
jgi:heterodisulfide reductase subunit B